MLSRPYDPKIPAVLDALYQAFTAAFTTPNDAGQVAVRDGPWTAGESGGPVAQDVALAWGGWYPGYQYPTRALSEEMGEAAITGTSEVQGWAPGQKEEFTVGCASFVLSGIEANPGNWSQLRHLAYGNIGQLARYIADPPGGERYLDDTVESLTIAQQTACHQVAQRRGVLCIVTFSLYCCTTSQQLEAAGGFSATCVRRRRCAPRRRTGPGCRCAPRGRPSRG